MPAHIELHRLTKRYGGVTAVNDVSLSIDRGSIHGLVGENGAGKSTVGKIISGVVEPSFGDVLIDGERVRLGAPRQALARGIARLDQELAMVPMRPVIDNVFLGSEQSRHGRLDRVAQRHRLAELLERTGFDLDPDARVDQLRTADQQKVEILRALVTDARLLVLDEPTARLTGVEASQLYRIVRQLRDEGTTVVFVSHFLEEVLELCDVVTVMRDGRHVRTAPASEETPNSLVQAMLGRAMEGAFPPKASTSAGKPILEVSRLTRDGAFEDISFQVRAGEIVGLAGLVGSGRSEVARAIFGADQADSGTIAIDDRPVRFRGPADAIRHGVAFVPESRQDDGLVMMRSVAENLALPHVGTLARGGVVARRRERARVEDVITRVDVRCDGPGAALSTLSGGNQQKVLIGKWLLNPPRVLIADEPTRGVDIGAKRTIYDLLHSLASAGMALLIISSELEELLGLAHRVIVLRRGRIAADLTADDASEERVLAAAFGTKEAE